MLDWAMLRYDDGFLEGPMALWLEVTPGQVGWRCPSAVVLPLEAALVASEKLGLFHDGVMVLFNNLRIQVVELDT